MALRTITHAMRGWPTPFGAALNASAGLFDEAGACRDAKDALALSTVAEQVVGFATLRTRPEAVIGRRSESQLDERAARRGER